MKIILIIGKRKDLNTRFCEFIKNIIGQSVVIIHPAHYISLKLIKNSIEESLFNHKDVSVSIMYEYLKETIKNNSNLDNFIIDNVVGTPNDINKILVNMKFLGIGVTQIFFDISIPKQLISKLVITQNDYLIKDFENFQKFDKEIIEYLNNNNIICNSTHLGNYFPIIMNGNDRYQRVYNLIPNWVLKEKIGFIIFNIKKCTYMFEYPDSLYIISIEWIKKFVGNEFVILERENNTNWIVVSRRKSNGEVNDSPYISTGKIFESKVITIIIKNNNNPDEHITRYKRKFNPINKEAEKKM